MHPHFAYMLMSAFLISTSASMPNSPS
uniref:Uncharacterized protein n=1 Tax=Arundo donax TaxID=35708 RepID=A0A0A8ZN02_ARUDO